MKNKCKLYSKLYNIGIFKKYIVNKIISSNNSRNIYFFAKNVKNLDNTHLSLLVDKLVETSKGYTLLSFVKNIDLDLNNINKISKAISKISNPKIVYEYYNYVKPKDEKIVEDITDRIIKSWDPEYIYLFAKKIRIENTELIEKLTKSIIKTRNYYYMDLFLEHVKNMNLDSKKLLLENLIKTPNINELCKYSLKYSDLLTNDNITYLCDSVIKKGDPSLMYYTSRDLKLSDDNLNNIVISISKSDNSEYIYYFLRDIKAINEEQFNLLLNRIKDLSNSNYIKQLIMNIMLPKSEIIDLYKILIDNNDIGTYSILNNIMIKYSDISFLEKVIFKSKKMNVIIDYLFFKKDINLIKKIFGSIKDFYDVVMITSNIHFDKNDLNKWLKEYVNVKKDYKYIDENINKYIESKKTFD